MIRPTVRPVVLPVLRAPGALSQSLGPELVVNGDFATDTVWTKGLQWVIAAGVATKVGPGTSLLQQSIAIAVGATYRVTYTITLTVTAGDGMGCFLGQTQGSLRSAPGTYTELVTPGLGTNLEFLARGGGLWEGSIDNVSVRQVVTS